MGMTLIFKTPSARNSTVRIHPVGVNQQTRGRSGATVIVPAIDLMNGSELRDHIDLINGRNPGRELTREQVEKALETKAKKSETPQTVAEMLARGMKPPKVK